MTLPDFSGAPLLALDIETHDPDLADLGPGPRRPDGKILGIGVADGRRSVYVPLAHPGGENVPAPQAVAWLAGLRPKAWVGANLLYDLDWLASAGFTPDPAARLLDVQYAEPLLDENQRSYALDNLAQRRLGTRKDEARLTELCLLNGWRGKPQTHLAKMTAADVGPYCRVDCELTYDIIRQQEAELAAQGLTDLFALECRLMPLLLKMRRVGVRFDEARHAAVTARYAAKLEQLTAELTALAGFEVNVSAARSVREAFEARGLPFAYTEKGNPCFNEDALRACPDPLAQKILELRGARTIAQTFLAGLARHVTGGRIHCQFHPLRGDQYGTVSGRFSSSNPNLQQQPSRDEAARADVRGLFLPEEGHDWLKLDYAQIELRVLAHYGRGKGAEEIRAAYRANPDLDFHQLCADLVNAHRPDRPLPRKTCKSINFGVVYGMGKAKMAAELGLAPGATAQLMSEYHALFPFLRQTSREACDLATRRGYVRTMLGRRRRFPDARWAYKALNSVIQGTAADVMKAAMVRSWDAGIYDVLVPHLTVHDELDQSVPRTVAGREAARELIDICEGVFQGREADLRVPLRVDAEAGPSWAAVAKTDAYARTGKVFHFGISDAPVSRQKGLTT